MNDGRLTVSPAQARRRQRSRALIIDVRDRDEWDAMHIPGARLLPLPELRERNAEVPRDLDVLLICRSGRRSGEAQAYLINSLGYRSVFNVAGGMVAWHDAHLPVVGNGVESRSGNSRLRRKAMYFKQFYLGCLAHASYLIGSDGEGVVVDPQRDVQVYIEAAKDAGLALRYVIETHVHADFVSGHRELAERTGAEVVFGRRAGVAMPHIAVADGDSLRIGSVRLDILETPGHTPESISIVVCDESDSAEPPRVLTGDTLFIGDVGRPDLAGSKGYSPEQMAAMLYDSLHEKLLRLKDEVEVYPAHGAGSLCGRNMSKETWSTLGEQRSTNYALQPMSKDEFVTLMTSGLPEQPAYFATDAELNRSGAPALDQLPKPRGMSPAAVRRSMRSGDVILDVRSSETYGPRHIHGSLNIGLDGSFAGWAGALIPFTRPIIIVAADNASVAEAVVRLSRVGLDNVAGYLEGGLTAWEDAGYPVVDIAQISVLELNARLERGVDTQLIDVRRPVEFASGAAPTARNIPLTELERTLDEVDPSRSITVICGSGYRSSAATSILQSSGFTRLSNVDGGMNAYRDAKLAVAQPQNS